MISTTTFRSDRMPAKKWLALAFVASLVVWLIWLLPASVLISRADGLRVGGGTLELDSIHGRWWRGQAAWQWQELAGNLVWTIEWRGLTPGADVSFNGSLQGSGWVGSAGGVAVRDLTATLPAALVERFVPDLKLNGTLSVRSLSLSFSDDQVTDADGQLTYTGGTARFRRQEPVEVPPLVGEIDPTDEGLEVRVQSPRHEDTLAQAAIRSNMGSLTVYRAWAAVLGLSAGGAPGDVIFETSLPLWQR